MNKRCTRCGEVKSVTEFNKFARNRDGLQPWCRSCQSEHGKARYAANPDAERARNAAWNRSHPEYRHDPAVARKWRAANPERARSNLRSWKAANPEAVRRHWTARRARERDAICDVHESCSTINPVDIYEREHGTCWLCLKPVGRSEFNLEHVSPLSLGGKHCQLNLLIAHPVCNSRKGKTPAMVLYTTRAAA